MSAFFFQVDLPLDEIAATVRITQTAAPSQTPGNVSVIFDLDLFRDASLPSGPELWPLFEQFRIWKNRVFEACITDRVRELIR